jgi:hypothetical protein
MLHADHTKRPRPQLSFLYLTEKRDGQLPEFLRVANVAKDNLVERQAVRLGRGELLLVLERLDHELAADCKSRCADAIPSQNGQRDSG